MLTKAAAALSVAAITAVAAPAMPAMASGWDAPGAQANVLQIKDKGCPPGLAKKHNGCTPPGLAKKQDHRDGDHHHAYRRGDVIDGDYTVIRDPALYRLNPARDYYRVGDNVYLVDRETNEVLEFVGAMAALLN